MASHIKPWRVCSNAERLDGNNGLLLSPHVDKLFDQGWISFADDGTVLCADNPTRELMGLRKLDVEADAGKFSKAQRVYLTYHRKEVYRGAK